MRVSLNNVYKLITDNNYKSAKVYEGDITEGSRPFESIVKESSSALIDRLKDLEQIINGRFTLLLGKGTPGEQKRNMTEVKTEFYETIINTEPINMNGTEVFENSTLLNEKVDKLVRERMMEMEKDNKIKDLEDKLKEVDSLGGKLNYFLTGFIAQFMQEPTTTNMNGFGFKKDKKEDLVHPNESEFLKSESTDNLKESEKLDQMEMDLTYIIDYLGEENISKFANKIRNGTADSVRPLIINFLNN